MRNPLKLLKELLLGFMSADPFAVDLPEKEECSAGPSHAEHVAMREHLRIGTRKPGRVKNDRRDEPWIDES